MELGQTIGVPLKKIYVITVDTYLYQTQVWLGVETRLPASHRRHTAIRLTTNVKCTASSWSFGNCSDL
jgi:hypothetical protein